MVRNMGPLTLLLTLLTVFCDTVYGARFLLHASQQVSHVQEQVEVGRALVARGHEVYVILDSAYPRLEAIEKAGVIPVFYEEPEGVDTFLTYHEKTSSRVFNDGGKHIDLRKMVNLLNNVCVRMLENEMFIKELKDLEFDLVIVDAFVIQMCNFALPVMLDVPHVYLFAGIIDFLAGIPSMPSFAPTVFSMSSDRMTFVERLKNTLYTGFMLFAVRLSDDVSLFGKYTDGQTMREVMAKSELFIVTRDHILEWPLPSLPNVVRVPGLTIGPARELPSDLKETIGATKAIAVVSFGSSIDSFPTEIMKRFIQSFSSFSDVTFLFKVSKDLSSQLDDVPGNVKLLPWLPQQDLLAHDKTVLFITHCGNNGQYESVYHGVPMIGFPMFAEQHHNCFRMEDKHLGVCMDILTFTSDELSTNIKLILEENGIIGSVKKRSAIIKSMGSPTELIVDKLEHVLEFGSEHLRSASQDIPLYQLLMLDILAVVCVVIILLLLGLKKVVTRIIKMCQGPEKTSTKGKID